LVSITGCGDDDDDDGNDAGAGGSRAGTGGRTGGTGGVTAGRGGSGGTAGRTGGTGGVTAGTGGVEDAGAGGTDAGAGGVSAGAGGTDAGAGGVSGEGGSGGSGGEGGAPAPTCEDYCDTMLGSCTATADRQYPNPATDAAAAAVARTQCLNTCAAFPTTADPNSFSCRLREAELVASDGAAHCDRAGPAGITTCGTPCAGYCNLMVAYCANEDEGASLTACLAACGTVPANNPVDFVYPGPIGNTLSCRIAHATNAARFAAGTTDRITHCDHAAGDMLCVAP